jgi:hypothetical protein
MGDTTGVTCARGVEPVIPDDRECIRQVRTFTVVRPDLRNGYIGEG